MRGTIRKVTSGRLWKISGVIVGLIFLLSHLCLPVLSAQVTYDNNATEIGAANNVALIQNAFTVSAGDDRVLVAFVMRDGFASTTDSITYDGQQLTLQITKDNNGIYAEMWSLALGCGTEISDSLKAFFGHPSNNFPDASIAAATFQNVDQFNVIGESASRSGLGGSSGTLVVSTSDTDGLIIGNVSTGGSSSVNITPNSSGQIEIYEQQIGNNYSQGGTNVTTGGNDQLSWDFNLGIFDSPLTYAAVAMELISSDQDGDGVADCNDLCPLDPLKSDPGICGCGVADIDSDGDGTLDCNDHCPLDSLKIDPGICGCGVIDIDADSNGIADCIVQKVTYDSNAVVIAAIPSTGFVQDTFTVPAGTDRLLVAYVMRDGNSTVTDSITFNGQLLTNQFQQIGGGGMTVELWYLTLGCGVEITDSIKGYFRHLGGGSPPDVIVAASSFQFVDQSMVFGDSQSQFGSGGSTGTLNMNTADTTGLIIGTVGTDVSSGTITIAPNATGQFEIFETSIPGNNNSSQGSIKATSGGIDNLNWFFSGPCEWVSIGAELLVSDQDGDGIADCDDLCPLDSLKSEPGICGCGVADNDSDGDGTLDCNDLCPLDSLKINPGFCGCGVIDADTDGNGIVDCIVPHVTYDSNAVVIAANPGTGFVQDTFTVPAGTDRLLVVHVMRDGSSTVTDSITFNGQLLTNQFQQLGGGGMSVELWHLTLGCGVEITDSIKGYFHHLGGGSLPDVIIAASSYQNVDQSVVFGDSDSQAASSASSGTLNLNTADTTGLIIGIVGTDVDAGTITISPFAAGQFEIFETAISGNNNSLAGSNKMTSGGTDDLRWDFSSFCKWAIIGAELLVSDQDGDGVADCNDLCPLDSLKTEPGFCGCGVVDVDTDGDGTLDCNDLCPLDSLKIDPGICGCGVIDVDADNNGFADCIVPHVIYDSNTVVIATSSSTGFVKNSFTVPEGTDRLLTVHVMRDGASTVTDSITFNGQHLTLSQQFGGAGLSAEIWHLTLGCGVEITDSIKGYFRHLGGGSLPDVILAAASYQYVDQSVVFGDSGGQSGFGGGTGTLNLNTDDSTGLIIGAVATDVASGTITIMPNSVGQIEIFDTSIIGNNNSMAGSIKMSSGGTDGLSWIFSGPCNWVSVGAELLVSDQDGDNVYDCNDLCPDDSLKVDPGICGCGVVDIDTDGDGTLDCNDLCPLDSLKIDPGICGCGVVDVDTDSNGLADCIVPHVTFDSNAVVIGASASIGIVQDTFKVPEGIDRLLVAFVTRDGSNTVTDSITFNGQHLTQQFEQAGDAELNSEMWSLTLGCGIEIIDSVKSYFSHNGGGNLPDVIVAAASFQFVDQSTVFGDSDSAFGPGSFSAPLSLNTADTAGLIIGLASTDVTSGFVNIAPVSQGQFEIFEQTINGNNNSSQGSIKTPTGAADDLQWSFTNFCNWVVIGAELLVSDQDGDSVFDCNDLCPNDPLKIDPGICGCGVVDLDTDGDGTADCNDLCPLDSLKIEPGFCGCGVVEDLTDSDLDGTPDCADLCPLDSLKIDPGICGCGVAEDDSDGDGTVDCIDACPNDSTLIADMDSDGDGFADCIDPCPFDSLKVDPGTCGCGIPDIDSDMDGIPDCAEQGDVLLFAGANPNGKGPMMQGSQITPGGDTTVLWSLGNRSGLDSAVTFMQHRNDNLYFGAGNLIGMTIDPSGPVGIGMQPTSNQLEVNGNASKSTPGNWLGNSDARLKKNIQPLDPKETLSKMLQLHGVTYTWNDTVTGIDRPQGMQYGFLAQDIQKVYPQLVVEDANGYLQTSYGTFDPMILEGIRRISQEMDSIGQDLVMLMLRMDSIEHTLNTEPKNTLKHKR